MDHDVGVANSFLAVLLNLCLIWSEDTLRGCRKVLWKHPFGTELLLVQWHFSVLFHMHQKL